MVNSRSAFKFGPDGTKKQQVADDLRKRIAVGELRLGDSLGDQFKVADYYGCSFGTVSAAQRILVAEGLLSDITPGKPTRVIAVPSAGGQEIDRALSVLIKLRADVDDAIRSLSSTR